MGVLDALDALASSRVPLGEASMFVEPTRALVAVDVNTGGDASPAAGAQGRPSPPRASCRASFAFAAWGDR